MTHNLLLLSLAFGGADSELLPPAQAPPVQAPPALREPVSTPVLEPQLSRQGVAAIVPSPPTYHLVRFTDGVWRWVFAAPTALPAPAGGSGQSVPFAVPPPPDTTRTTGATTVALFNTGWQGGTGTGLIRTGALSAATHGVINGCGQFG